MKFKKLLSTITAFAISASMAVMPMQAEAADIIVYDSYTTAQAHDMLRIYLDEFMETGETYEFSFNVKPESVDVQNSVRVDLGFQGSVTSPGNYGIFYLYENATNALGLSDYNKIGNVSAYKDAVAAEGIDFDIVWDTEAGVADITAGFPGKDYNLTYNMGVVPEGGSYGSFIIWAESTTVTITDLVIKKQEQPAPDPDAPLYEKAEWTISGEHNYIQGIGNTVGLQADGKYVIEFDVTETAGNQVGFYFDWRDYANVTKSGCASWNYKALAGIYDDGSNDCLALGKATPWVGTVKRDGMVNEYSYTIVWDVAASKFDMTLDYKKTSDGSTGTYTASFTSSNAFRGDDVLKFATGGTATIKNLKITNWQEPAPDPDAPLYEKAEWAVSGEHNYIQGIGKTVGLQADGKYVIEFDVTAPTGNPGFYFDWRDYANVTKSACSIWQSYVGLVGIFDDGSKDCVSVGSGGFKDYLARDGQPIEYHYNIVWDVAASKFDIAMNYKKTSDGSTGSYTASFTSSNAFRDDDVLKFATGSGTATIKNLKITNWKETVVEPEPEPETEDYYVASHTTSKGGEYFTTKLDNYMENGGKYEILYNIKPESLTGFSIRCDVMNGSASNQGNYGFFLLYDDGVNALGMSDYNKIGKVEEHTADVVTEGVDIYMLWDTVTGIADIKVTFPTGQTYNYTWNAGVIPADGSFGELILQSPASKATITDLYIRETGEAAAPVLSASNVKLYADDAYQAAAKVSSFTNKLVVDFGQRMKKADMKAENIFITEKGSADAIAGEFAYENGIVTINYADGFAAGKTYTIHINAVRNSGSVETVAYEKDFEVAGGVNAQLVSVVQGGSEVTTAAGLNSGLAKLNVYYSNENDAIPVLHIISAFYNGGKLVKSDFFDWTPEDRDTISYEFNYTVPAIDSYDEVQFMIWDGFDTIKPLSAPITLK